MRDRGSLVAALWTLVAVGLVGAARVMWWYWPGSFFDGVTSHVWAALAWDAAHGVFYRPLLGPDGYGGTRYMPLLFLLHALLIRWHVDLVASGIALMQGSVVAAAAALCAALRVADVPRRLAWPLAGTLWATVLFQRYCTDLRADYLAAALALVGAALAQGAVSEPRSWRLVGAAGACALAALTKMTAVLFVVPIVVSLVAARRRDLAARFAAGTVALVVVAAGAAERASAGRFLENIAATISGGMVVSDLRHTIPKFAQELVADPFVSVPFAIAVACWYRAARDRRLGFAHIYFAGVALVTIAVFTSPGIVANQLVDLELSSTLVVGVALANGDFSRRVAAWIYAGLAVLLAAISIPLPRIPSVIGTLQAQGPRQRAVVQAVHDGFLPPGARYLSTDPGVAILAGQRPVVLDAFSLDRFVRDGTPAGRDVERRIRAREFDVVVLRDTSAFVHDMNAGDRDPASDAATVRYWAEQPGPLAQLIRTTYEIRAVRRPFVILAAKQTGP
ncbi:MAG: hypothetical protein ABUS56_10005 [Acidobacteriota bacterium]